MIDIEAKVVETRRRVESAARRAGRDPASVTLMAVSKTVPAERVQRAVDDGVRVLGENRVQEAERKIPLVRGDVEWHLIGRLQSNKARLAAALFDAVHSVDRESLVDKLAAAARRRERPLPVYVQVELVRTGASDRAVEANAHRLCCRVAETAELQLCGLMTMPPYEPDPEASRPWFRRLRALRDEIESAEGLALPCLSMGMSNDFEIAIEEGATIVRLGTILFGARS